MRALDDVGVLISERGRNGLSNELMTIPDDTPWIKIII